MMTFPRMFALAASFVAFTTVAGPAAWSQVVPVWSSAASGCVPSALSVYARRFVTPNYYVAHRGTNVAAISLICPITETTLGGSAWSIEFTYMDSTGFGPGATAAAKVMSLSRTTGVSAQVVKFSSDTSAVAAINKGAKPFTHTFDFIANVYFVHIILDRSNQNQDVRAYGVAILPEPI